MTDIALRDVNKIPDSEKMNGCSSNGNFTKPQAVDQNAEEKAKKGITLLVSGPTKPDETENSGEVLANPEVEYIESEDLKDVENMEDCLRVEILSMYLYMFYQYPLLSIDVGSKFLSVHVS